MVWFSDVRKLYITKKKDGNEVVNVLCGIRRRGDSI